MNKIEKLREKYPKRLTEASFNFQRFARNRSKRLNGPHDAKADFVSVEDLTNAIKIKEKEYGKLYFDVDYFLDVDVFRYETDEEQGSRIQGDIDSAEEYAKLYPFINVDMDRERRIILQDLISRAKMDNLSDEEKEILRKSI